MTMFAVIFEVHPKPAQWDRYLGTGKMLRPELEGIEGFVDNVRYRSLTRDGWILSLSGWRDEKSVVRWRIRTRHHEAQEMGRNAILLDYHLRVGELTRDTALPSGHQLREQRLDATEIGDAIVMTLIDMQRPDASIATTAPRALAAALGLPDDASSLVAWDVFDAVLTPGDVILLMSWKDQAGAADFAETVALPDGARLRQVRVVRDYGMFDRREAPQYFPDAAGGRTIHAGERK
jgi:heme-degrading monooxygenase HmoA